MKNTLIFTVILIFLFGVNSTISAQEKTISPEKLKLIAELIEVTETNSQIVEITDILIDSLKTTYPAIIERSLGEVQLDPAEKEKLSKEILTSFVAFNTKFRERLPKEIDYKQYVKDTVYPLYDKYFTEIELKDMIAFYKTETGRKVIKTMPTLFAESSKLADKHLMPKVMKLIDELMEKEIVVIREKISKSLGNR